MQQRISSEALVDELRRLRERVMGITESVVSTADGLLVAADTVSVQPESLSALAAATLALGRRTSAEAGLGGMRENVTRAGGGFVVVTAIGEHALLVVVGDEGLDVAALGRECPGTVEALGRLLTAAA
ncbi:roadblock/LC7 domain-containing protein [Kitasatospora sp. NPDC094015]|uniref:roadblock/LC7 domain-containing protein n=1 Tax=Kitasatospora sp. NPDC094015 TaxID=3155205 RepID=UPI00331CF03C